MTYFQKLTLTLDSEILYIIDKMPNISHYVHN